MAKPSYLKSGAIAALAASLALAALPSPAAAQDRWQGRWGGGEAQGQVQREAGAGGWQRGRATASQQQEAAPAPQDPQQRNWANRGGDGDGRSQRRSGDAPRWGSQRPESGERYGRDWQRGGEVYRPAPALNGATPNAPERGFERHRRADWNGDRDWNRDRSGRNPTYADPDRNRTYRDGYRDERREGQWRDRRDDRWRDSHHRWNHDWRRNDRYNWYSYRNTHRHVYRPGRYYAPYRYHHYRRLSVGFYLDTLFFGSRYWIADPWYYRLPPAYGPYRWVRYYDDVLLVNIYTGEVVDVIYDFFW